MNRFFAYKKKNGLGTAQSVERLTFPLLLTSNFIWSEGLSICHGQGQGREEHTMTLTAAVEWIYLFIIFCVRFSSA